MRVLLIEDFELLRDSLATGLREAGFAVDVAAEGKTGLWYATTIDYDVIILDLMLPEIDGLSILKQLRSEGRGTHVLILTAKDTSADRVTGLDAGADDYLVKPFDFAELLARVRALVRRKYDAKSPTISVADLELDTTTRSVRRGGQVVELSAREFALLEFLASRAGQVVSRTEIWEHVYEFNSTADSNVVDAFIRLLRRKIESPDLPKLIHTRRGHGYCLGEKP
ncbi:MAG TPA: response regulator transcription factor [Pirellulales bacterium]|jgi:DNA-binding response OmpR family regulator